MRERAGNSPANWPNSEKPMPIGRISVGKISETYRYMVVSQQVLDNGQYIVAGDEKAEVKLTPGRPGTGR